VRAGEPAHEHEIIGDLDVIRDVVDADVDALLGVRELGGERR